MFKCLWQYLALPPYNYIPIINIDIAADDFTVQSSFLKEIGKENRMATWL